MKSIKIALLALFTLVGVAGMAQKKGTHINHRLAKADSILIVKLELTDAEQKAFLPLYHEFVKEKKANRKKYFSSEVKGKKKIDELSEEELDQVIQQRFAFKQADLDIQKKYHEKFKKVLPIKKVAKFYYVEKRIYKRGKGMYDSSGEKRKRGKDKK